MKHDSAMRAHAWNPADGPGPAPQQRIPSPPYARGDGTTERDQPGALWAASQGPSRREMGGAGGEPSGHTVPIRKVCWD